MSTETEQLRYPVGRFRYEPSDAAELKIQIERITSLPGKLRSAIAGLSDKQLDTPYREGGWTLRQVIHHLPDSQINALKQENRKAGLRS